MKEQQTVWVVSNISEETLLPLSVDQVSKIAELPPESPFAIILSKGEDQDWIELLSNLRSKKEYRFTPVFYHGDVEPHLCQLFDGPADADLASKAALIYERIRAIGSAMKESEDYESLLLSYLYSRPEARLTGYISAQSSFIYEYPLLTILLKSDKQFDGWRFLQDLTMRELLVQDALIDEIQTCSSCESGLLNFKNSCPSCHSIDIKPQKFVHCFSCGKIGPVPEFLRQERLICSRCNTKLHELGVDYEKPAEDKLCNNCGHFFAESEVDIVCLVCNKTSSPQELTSRRLYEYILTKRGEYLVRGIEKSIYRNFNHFFKVIDYATFMSIVSWQVKLAERYSPIYFSIMTLHISNEHDLLEQKGEAVAERLMGQLFTNLRQVFRESDLSSRLDGTMFFLLPMSNQDGCLVILDRIKQTVKQLAEDEMGKDLTVGVSYITSAEINNGATKGNLILAELHAKMVESNSCLIGAK